MSEIEERLLSACIEAVNELKWLRSARRADLELIATPEIRRGMTDIVERLRATLIPELYVEAADEIERLRVEIERLREMYRLGRNAGDSTQSHP